ncbi:kinase-like domain-containing protein [Podospora appendiculata]|uniref:non-specific serine/threonine protein kinase n=1 Tax=Podospora appendiculata TaxID=314037 RepID=A0AAE0X8I5_9PEZI|nr:kinase-like domain-containing protein [Podospora appendiculata]
MCAQSLAKWVRTLTRRKPLVPLVFPTSGFELVPESEVLEEEMFDEFKSGQYYPVNIGDVYESKYQVLGKLGFGSTSTVWLARHLQDHGHVALKIYTREGADNDEFEMYGIIAKANHSHPGYHHVRTALDKFVLHGPGGDHPCLVQKPMWDSWRDLLRRNPAHRFTEELLKPSLKQVLLALDYLHTECKIVHTDLKADNILQDIADDGILEDFTKAELETPSPRKFVNGAPVYMSRRFGLPRDFGGIVVSDFGAAVRGDLKRNHAAQPNVYRSPEVMLKAAWSYPADIWNLGALIWDIYEDKHMFYGQDPKEHEYMTRAHLAEVTGMLGPAPLDLIQRGVRSKEFFTEDGQWKADVPIPEGMSLEASEENLEGENKRLFLNFMKGMLQWRPEDRKTAKELLEDPWLNSPCAGQ